MSSNRTKSKFSISKDWAVPLVHLVLWLLLILTLRLLLALNESTEVYYINGEKIVQEQRSESASYLLFLSFIFRAISVYGALWWALPKYFNVGRNKSLFLSLAVVVLFPMLAEFLFIEVWLSEKYNLAAEQISLYYVFSIGLQVFLLSIAIGYWFVRVWHKTEQSRLTLRKEKLATEVDFLRSQINPHFLFNTLNNLFSVAQESHDYVAAQGIAQLSGLMRYMLYESRKDKVFLDKEIRYIEEFINLQKLRLSPKDPIEISFTVKGEVERKTIEPLLLIPFVENAFKHGIYHSKRSTISFELDIHNGFLKFIGRNTVHRKSKTVSEKKESGIGLENVKKRLALIYKEDFELTIDENEQFEVKLIVPVEN